MTVDEIVNALVAERQHRKWSQKKVADLIGTAQSAVSEWETGISVPTLDSAARWSAALGMALAVDWAPGPIPPSRYSTSKAKP